MWHQFAFLFLFLFNGLFFVNTRYHHINEVFNSLTHDHLYSVTENDIYNEEVYFNKTKVREMVTKHFKDNMKRTSYEFIIVFYQGNEESTEFERSNFFTIKLLADIGFLMTYNKTFSYYLT